MSTIDYSTAVIDRSDRAIVLSNNGYYTRQDIKKPFPPRRNDLTSSPIIFTSIKSESYAGLPNGFTLMGMTNCQLKSPFGITSFFETEGLSTAELGMLFEGVQSAGLVCRQNPDFEEIYLHQELPVEEALRKNAHPELCFDKNVIYALSQNIASERNASRKSLKQRVMAKSPGILNQKSNCSRRLKNSTIWVSDLIAGELSRCGQTVTSK